MQFNLPIITWNAYFLVFISLDKVFYSYYIDMLLFSMKGYVVGIIRSASTGKTFLIKALTALFGRLSLSAGWENRPERGLNYN